MSRSIPIDGSRKGYIRLHRNLLDDPIFRDKPEGWLKIWIYINLAANWRDSEFRPASGPAVVVPAGALVTSLEKIATHTALTKEHARRCLDFLERTQRVTLERTHHWTKVTILEWAAYQRSEEDSHHSEHHDGHHSKVAETTHRPPHQTPHSATPSKEKKNSNQKNKSNSFELDSSTRSRRSSSALPSTVHVDPATEAWFDEEFWPIYPRHEGRGKALLAAAAKATTPELRQHYVARLSAQLPEYERRKRERGQHSIPMGSTWFEEDRADDELAPPVPSPDMRERASTVDYPEYVPLAVGGAA